LRESFESERRRPPVAEASSARRVLGLARADCSAVSKDMASSRVTARSPALLMFEALAAAARASILAASRVRSACSRPVALTP